MSAGCPSTTTCGPRDMTRCSTVSLTAMANVRVVPSTRPLNCAGIGPLTDALSGMDAAAGSLDQLLELAARDDAAGLGDAPWPPHFRKTEGEAPRVAPSRARGAAKVGKVDEKTAALGTRASKMPLITVANSPDKQAALAGLERWKARHADAAEQLAVDDVLVDAMRGRSSTWTRIRLNLRHVPEAMRPPQETPDPDDDPTREWRRLSAEARKRGDGDGDGDGEPER